MASTVRWGIIGCGDVTEVKSGPALQKAARSSLIAVMRRDGDKAADYARRHGVPRWYDDADALIADPGVDAVYVATPPDTHLDYTRRVLAAGKPVLVEKPMASTLEDCDAMVAAAEAASAPVVVAYYRRALPRFREFARIATGGTIGVPRTVTITHLKPATAGPKAAWVRSAVGGIFADTQCHTIDWLGHVFGPAANVNSITGPDLAGHEDLVCFTARFGQIAVTATCAYSVAELSDSVVIHGDRGSVGMSFFKPSPVRVRVGDRPEDIQVDDPPHVHQPFVEQVVACLLDGAQNPCSAEDARRASFCISSILRS